MNFDHLKSSLVDLYKKHRNRAVNEPASPDRVRFSSRNYDFTNIDPFMYYFFDLLVHRVLYYEDYHVRHRNLKKVIKNLVYQFIKRHLEEPDNKLIMICLGPDDQYFIGREGEDYFAFSSENRPMNFNLKSFIQVRAELLAEEAEFDPTYLQLFVIKIKEIDRILESMSSSESYGPTSFSDTSTDEADLASEEE